MKTITRKELNKMKDKREDFVLINVLSKEYFDKEHIRGSINIPIMDKDFEKKVMKHVSDKRTKIVVYCANKECQASPDAAKKLIKLGYKNVWDYEGGIKEYCASQECHPVAMTA